MATETPASENTLYPCPSCGRSRGRLHAACPHCGWATERNTTPVPAANKSQPLNKTAAMAVGMVTLVPLLYIVFFFMFILMAVMTERVPDRAFVLLVVAHMSVILLTWSLVGYYIYYLFKTDFVPAGQKALWAVVLFLGNFVAMPVFWYWYVWKPAEREGA